MRHISAQEMSNLLTRIDLTWLIVKQKWMLDGIEKDSYRFVRLVKTVQTNNSVHTSEIMLRSTMEFNDMKFRLLPEESMKMKYSNWWTVLLVLLLLLVLLVLLVLLFCLVCLVLLVHLFCLVCLVHLVRLVRLILLVLFILF